MNPMATPGVRSEPDPSVTSASPAPPAPAFAALDRRMGWLAVNRWTYRPLRLLGGLVRPQFDDTGVEVTEVDAEPRLLVVRPVTVRAAGAVLLLHGGGYVIGSPEDALSKAALLARECGVPVVCPAYRLGPEHPFPAGLDDAHAAWSWLQASAGHLGVDPGRIVVAADGAGARLPDARRPDRDEAAAPGGAAPRLEQQQQRVRVAELAGARSRRRHAVHVRRSRST